jgi:hypothetical protein
VPFLAIVTHDRARVVNLVSERHTQDRVVFDFRQVGKIAALALDPSLRRIQIDSVRAALDDGSDARAELRLIRSSIGRPPPSSTASCSIAAIA